MSTKKNETKNMHYIVYDGYNGRSNCFEDLASAEKEAARRVTVLQTTAYDVVIYKSLKRAETKMPDVDWVEYTAETTSA